MGIRGNSPPLVYSKKLYIINMILCLSAKGSVYRMLFILIWLLYVHFLLYHHPLVSVLGVIIHSPCHIHLIHDVLLVILTLNINFDALLVICSWKHQLTVHHLLF